MTDSPPADAPDVDPYAPPSRAELVGALPVASEPAVAAARRAAAERPLPYALGSAQAEEVALLARLKPALRQQLPEARIAEKRAWFEARGLHVADAPCAVSHETPDRHLEARYSGRVLLAARDPARLREMVALEERQDALTEKAHAEGLTDGESAALRDAVREMGRLLGYPRCCVEAFTGAPHRAGPGGLHGARAALDATRGRLEPRLNGLDLEVFHYLPWMPCRYDCPPSLAYADALAARIGRHARAFVAAVDRALAATRLALLDDVQLSLAGRWEGAELAVEAAWPTARDRRPGAPLHPDALEAVARLLALVEARPRVAVDGDRVLIGGEAVATCPGARLFPFGRPPLPAPGAP